MRRHPTAWTVALFLFLTLAVVPQANAQKAPSPIGTLEDLEAAHRGTKGEVHIGSVMTLTYSANTVEAEPRYFPALIELSKALKAPQREHYQIVLRGYSDISGDFYVNQRLSRQRAAYLGNLLVHHPSMSLDQKRILVEGLGEKNPIAPNTTAEGRRQNRRVEIHLYGAVAKEGKQSALAAAPLPSPQKAEAPPEAPAKQALSIDAQQPPVPASAAAGTTADAAGTENVPLSLLDAIRYGLEGNQDIQVVSYTPKQAEEELADAESVYDPEFFADSRFRRDPNLQSSITRIVMEDDGLFTTGIRKPLSTGGSITGAVEARYGDLLNSEIDRTYKYTFAPLLEVRQPLLKNIGAREEKTAIKIANFQLDISEEEFREKTIEIANRISRAYWQLYLLRQFVAIDRQNFEMAEEVYRRERVRVTEGLSQPLDVERARSNAQSRQSNLFQSRQRLEVATDRLKLLMNWSDLNIDSEVAIVPTETPQTAPQDIAEEAAIEKALQNRPELRKADQQVEIRKVEESLARHRRLPTLDLYGRYAASGYGNEFTDAYHDTAFNQENYWAVGMNFAYPIGNRSAEAKSRLKVFERQQSEAQVDRIRNRIKQDVKEVLLAIAFARGEIEANQAARESAVKVVDGEFVRFEIGQTTNEELLRAQDLLATASRNYARAVVEYNIAKAELSRAQGVLPEGVSIEDVSR